MVILRRRIARGKSKIVTFRLEIPIALDSMGQKMRQNPEHFVFSTENVSSFAFTIAKKADTCLYPTPKSL